VTIGIFSSNKAANGFGNLYQCQALYIFGDRDESFKNNKNSLKNKTLIKTKLKLRD
jgi:hypothetical protein